jgi:hypothetical protein
MPGGVAQALEVLRRQKARRAGAGPRTAGKVPQEGVAVLGGAQAGAHGEAVQERVVELEDAGGRIRRPLESDEGAARHLTVPWVRVGAAVDGHLRERAVGR